MSDPNDNSDTDSTSSSIESNDVKFTIQKTNSMDNTPSNTITMKGDKTDSGNHVPNSKSSNSNFASTFQFKDKFYGPFFFEAGRLLSHGKLKTLDEDDLLKPDDLRTETLYEHFQHDWQESAKIIDDTNNSKDDTSNDTKDSESKNRGQDSETSVGKSSDSSGSTSREHLLYACFHRELPEIILCGILYATYYGLQFMGPIFLKRILEGLYCREHYVNYNINNNITIDDVCTTKDTLFLYSFLISLSPLIGGFAFSHHNFRMAGVGNRIRSKLMAAIYNKCLRLSNASLQQVSTGRIVTLMSVDTESLRMFVPLMHTLWASPIFIAGSIILLYEELQWCAFMGFLAIILVLPLTFLIFKKLFIYRQRQAILQDQRTSLMAEIINGMKVIKYYTWELAFKARVKEIRSKELKNVWDTAWISSFFGVILFAAPTLISVIAIGAYALSGNTLTTTRAYTSLALFNILRIPLAMLPMVVQQYSNAKVSFSRLVKFLDEEESGNSSSNRKG